MTQVTALSERKTQDGNRQSVDDMRRMQLTIRIATAKQPVVFLFLLLTIVVQPLNLQAASACCTTPSSAPRHDCCPELQRPSGVICTLSSDGCSCSYSPSQSPTTAVNSRESSGRSELHPNSLKAVVPTLSLSFTQTTQHLFSQPESPPLTPLSQTCLLLI